MKHKDDRIPGLPEAIVEHILSFIPLKQILQLSILSKRWQNVIWTLFPIPEFVSTLRMSILYENSSNKKRQKIRVGKEEFNYFLERTLVSRNKQRVSINKLKLQIYGSSNYALMNRLTGYVIESNVKELDLDFQLNYYYYQVPKCFVAAKSITELSLHVCDSYLQVHVDEQILQTLIASSPVVKEISFDCYGLRRIHMSGFPKLIAVGLHCYNTTFESFEMEAPNLKKLELMHLSDLTDEWLHGILSKYPLIESLVLRYCEMLKRIKISSDHMKHLTIFQCNRLVEVDIVAPNLHKLDYYGDVISISSKTLTLSEVSIFFNNDPPLDAETIEFLAKLNHPKLLTWITKSAEVF
ncbi:hypothetical protein FH972_020766 [Carpinus fangiana]|uniref:F-box domain-containing protein n=1 Tax=Carpinus fangiana TaxID=176857 RepID=A0A5N6RXE9_9ROSI|nr:hypothetical protein FH972_020766 [Carpinus fangiana]